MQLQRSYDMNQDLSIKIKTISELQKSLENVYLSIEGTLSPQQNSKGKTYMWLSALILTALATLFNHYDKMSMITATIGALAGLLSLFALLACLYVLFKFELFVTWSQEKMYAKLYQHKVISQESDLNNRIEMICNFSDMIDDFFSKIILKRGRYLGIIACLLMASVILSVMCFVMFILQGGHF